MTPMIRPDELSRRAAALTTSGLSDAMDRLGIPGQVAGVRAIGTARSLCGPAYTVRYRPVRAIGETVGDFIDDVPASLHLPNLIAVGAVNQAGDETSFTSYGATVVVDADGYNVESYVPGGAKLRLSGTSMASPNVVNLAAKLFALDPALTPAQVIELIRQGATASEDGRRHLIDEKRSVALLKAKK